MPDVSMFNPLCNELGITINELLSGQKIKNEECQQKFEAFIAWFTAGSSVLNTDYIQRVIDNKKYIIFHSAINIYNKKRSDWEYKESLAKKLNGDKHIFSSFWHFDEETIKYDNIVVYYTNEKLKKISKMSDEEFVKKIKVLSRMCSLN